MSESRESAGGVPPDPELTARAFRELCDVVARLRAPDGCPWDRRQTLETIKPYTLEETYELLEAIDSGDDGAIVEELGDLLYAEYGAVENLLGAVKNMLEGGNWQAARSSIQEIDGIENFDPAEGILTIILCALSDCWRGE